MADAPTPAKPDLLYGAAEIANYLGCSPRRVYHANEVASGMPLRKRPGFGLYAIKSELDAWLLAPETLTQKRA